MKRIHLRSASSLVIIGAGMFAACSAEAPEDEDVQSTADALAKAAFTTFIDAEQCLHGSGNGINCNHYASKPGVYMNGGPVGNVLPDGEYYFTVLVPGSQNGGYVDDAPGNLSTPDGGDKDARKFSMVNGEVVNEGTHFSDDGTPNGKHAIQLWPFDDTTNNGGVYILAVCKWFEDRWPTPRECKYDMFKVDEEPYCGNGEIEGDEECDDGDRYDDDECRNDCTIPYCGDGIVDEGETCDDGDEDDTDECRNDCTAPTCGDGCLDPGEECDDGNTVDGDGCDADCQDEPECGNCIVEEGEACDDGNDVDTDGCRNDCTMCGDGVVQSSDEECDDGNTVGGDGCSAECTCEPEPPVCGDGVREGDEVCDGTDAAACDYECGGDCTCAECVSPEFPESCTPGADDCENGFTCDPSTCKCVCPDDVRSVAVD